MSEKAQPLQTVERVAALAMQLRSRHLADGLHSEAVGGLKTQESIQQSKPVLKQEQGELT